MKYLSADQLQQGKENQKCVLAKEDLQIDFPKL